MHTTIYAAFDPAGRFGQLVNTRNLICRILLGATAHAAVPFARAACRGCHSLPQPSEFDAPRGAPNGTCVLPARSLQMSTCR
jgi:hypothetical protein